jgi:hypothetical protein
VGRICRRVKRVDFQSGASFLPVLFISFHSPQTGHAPAILRAAQTSVMLKQEDAFAKTMLKASTVRGSPSSSSSVSGLGSRFPEKAVPDRALISSRCKPGFFNLESSNPKGCTPCFCFGHSSVCTNAVGYSVYDISSTFQIGNVALMHHLTGL